MAVGRVWRGKRWPFCRPVVTGVAGERAEMDEEACEVHDRGLSHTSQDSLELGEPLLELKRVSGQRKPRDVDLVVRRGEVVGVAGLLGSGRSSLARLLYGIDPPASGEIRLNGRTVMIANPRDALAAGIVLIPEDRNRQGVIAQHSVGHNIVLSVLDRISHYSWVSRREAARVINAQIGRLRIKVGSSDAPVHSLSGGNQQKVVLAKWLATQPDILVLDEPTAGIDIGSKAEIVILIREMARQGKAILLISSETPELLAASDRIVVMVDGRLVRDISRSEINPDIGNGIDPTERLRLAERRLQIAMQSPNSNG
jgi:ribose transport system ATP-binding protein